ncbi:amidohydrolase family protein [Teredinibacter purpureus]|uniref:amidohydrolase family protein n=1 Tax=Teredinibacter purpureus TaxID=2731756 RepID=UPI0006987540|nr:amidohydrolase family protein [Teredinibacter purpureus]
MNSQPDSKGTKKIEVVDGHLHLSSLEFTPKSFVDGIGRNVSERLKADNYTVPKKLLSKQLCKTFDDAEYVRLERYLSTSRIKNALILLPDFTYCLDDASTTIESMIDRHHELVLMDTRFEYFAGVDPRHGKHAFDIFLDAVENKMCKGLKIYPPCGVAPDDERFNPFYECCHSNGLPVLIHIGSTSPTLGHCFATPDLVANAAIKFPSVNFILAHGAIHHVRDCVMYARNLPNVYLDLSGMQSVIYNEQVIASYQEIFMMGINHKIIYGTDWPVFSATKTQGCFYNTLQTHGCAFSSLPFNEREMILSGNIRRLVSFR